MALHRRPPAERGRPAPRCCHAGVRPHGVAPEDVSDCHRFPIADNDAPRLCADRLEYTLGNLRSYGFADGDALRAFYADLTAANNEGGVPELAFRTPETACAFTEAALSTGRIYVADEDRFAMQALADLLRAALDRGVLTESDLHTTEPLVIRKLEADPETAAMWCRFRAYRRLDRTPRQPAGTGWIQVPAKLRYIDPLIAGVGRVSRCSPRIAGLLAEFRRTDLACWLRGE